MLVFRDLPVGTKFIFAHQTFVKWSICQAKICATNTLQRFYGLTPIALVNV